LAHTDRLDPALTGRICPDLRLDPRSFGRFARYPDCRADETNASPAGIHISNSGPSRSPFGAANIDWHLKSSHRARSV